MHRQLEVSGSLFFKIWKLDPRFKRVAWAAGAAGAAVAVLLTLLVIANWNSYLLSFSLTVGGFAIALAIVLIMIFFPAFKWLFPEKATRSIAQKLLIALLGSLATKLHVRIFDKMFLERGKLSRLLNLKRK